jgi:hypothetical protein
VSGIGSPKTAAVANPAPAEHFPMDLPGSSPHRAESWDAAEAMLAAVPQLSELPRSRPSRRRGEKRRKTAKNVLPFSAFFFPKQDTDKPKLKEDPSSPLFLVFGRSLFRLFFGMIRSHLLPTVCLTK